MKKIRSKYITILLTSLILINVISLTIDRLKLGPYDINVIYAKSQKHRSPKLLDQQIGILVGLAINPTWLKQQSQQQMLIYGVVKPSDTVPEGVKDYSYLATTNDDESIYLFFKKSGSRVTIKYSNHGRKKLRTKTISVSRLVHRFYRTKAQRQRVNKYLETLRTE